MQIGEPPLFLAASVFFAIKQAVLAARENIAADSQNADPDACGSSESNNTVTPDEVVSLTSFAPLGTCRPWLAFHSPASTERIRLACTDRFTQAEGIAEDYQPAASL